MSHERRRPLDFLHRGGGNPKRRDHNPIVAALGNDPPQDRVEIVVGRLLIDRHDQFVSRVSDASSYPRFTASCPYIGETNNEINDKHSLEKSEGDVVRATKTRLPSPPIGELDGRTRQGRRFDQLCAEFSSKYGPKGPLQLADQLRIKSAASLVLRLEQAQTAAASGAAFDPEEIASLTDLAVKAIHEAAPPEPTLLPFIL